MANIQPGQLIGQKIIHQKVINNSIVEQTIETTWGRWIVTLPSIITFLPTISNDTIQTESVWSTWSITSTKHTPVSDIYRIWSRDLIMDWAGTQQNSDSVITGYASTKYATKELNFEERIQVNKKEILRKMRARVQEAEYQRKKKEMEEKRRIADETAKQLLISVLSPEQLRRFEQDECIPVDTAKGNKYLIRKKRQINIDVIKNGRVDHRLCVQTQDQQVPDYDNMLMQLLYLKVDEDALLRTANRHDV